jgi:hypothetical protein
VITYVLAWEGVNSTILIQWTGEVFLIGASSHRLGSKKGCIPFLNLKSQSCPQLLAEVMRCEYGPTELKQLRPAEVTMILFTTLLVSVRVFSALFLHCVNVSPFYYWDFVKCEFKIMSRS